MEAGVVKEKTKKNMGDLKKTALCLAVLLLSQELRGSPLPSQVEVKPGPKSGIVIRDALILLLTERKLISQMIFIELFLQRAIERSIGIPRYEGDEFPKWYWKHLSQIRDSAKEILQQLQKTFASPDQVPKWQSQRFVCILIGAIVLTVLGMVVGTTITNSVCLSIVNAKAEAFKESLATIRAQMYAQTILNEDLIQTVNQSKLIQNKHSESILKMTNLYQKHNNTKNLFNVTINSITYVTQDFLRATQFNFESLILASIPFFFVSTENVRKILSQLHYEVVDEMQLSFALEMGSKVPMFVELDKFQMSFLLNLPLVLPKKIYQMNKELNVGSWKGEYYLKVRTPDMIFYQPWNDGTCLVSNLDTCLVFKDLNFLCPGKHVVPEFSVIGCGVTHPEDSLSAFEFTLSRPDHFIFNTVAVLVDQRWLVSTLLINMTVTYALHGTYKVMALEYRVLLITVPKDVIITVGNQAHFYVSGEEVQEDIMLINVLINEHLLIDSDIGCLLKNKPNHNLRFTARKANLSVDKYLFDRRDVIMLLEKDWMALKMYGMLISIGVLITWLFVFSINVYHNSCIYQLYGLNEKNIQLFHNVALEQIQITED